MPANWLNVHKEIRRVIGKHEEVMLMGGAGSSKTWTLAHVVCLRALLLNGSRHLCLRKRFEHAKVSLWNSIKEMINAEWPGLYDQIRPNRSGGSWTLTFPNGSEVHVGGMDDNERIEKWLGSEWATIYVNEASEVADEKDVDLVSSRLRQKIDGRHLLLLDMNPPAKSHWSYKRYIEDADKVKGRAAFKINPIDVQENLPASYIARLEALPERLRQRFLHGEFTSDIEGALWSWEMIADAKNPLSGEDGETVVAIDPAETSNENSDETGIIVACRKGNGAKIIEDLSIKASPNEWAQAAIAAYYRHEANYIIAEVNAGGDMIKTIIHHLDPLIPVKEVRATKGKATRCEPVVALYEQNLIEHAPNLGGLEDQMMSWVPHVSRSPDRVDAMVYCVHALMLSRGPSAFIGGV